MVNGRRRLRLALERFESIGTGDGLTLLRIAGRWEARSLERVPRPELILTSAAGETALELLPDPGALPAFADADPPPWRAGFALAGEPEPGTTYALRLADGREYELPRPAAGSMPAAAAGAPELEQELVAAERENARTEEALDLARQRLEEEIARRQAVEEQLELAAGGALDEIAEEAARRAEQVRELEARLRELREALDPS